MTEMELLNTFNVLCISSCRIVQENGLSRVYFRNVNSVFLVQLAVVSATSFCGLKDYYQRSEFYLQSTAQMTGAVRNVALTVVVLIVNMLLLIKRTKIYVFVEQLIRLDRQIGSLTNRCQITVNVRLVKLQVAFVFTLYSIILVCRIILCFVYYFPQFGLVVGIGLVLTVFVEFQMRLQQLFVQFFVEHLAVRYQLLRQLLPVKSPNQKRLIRSSLRLYHQLGSMQQLLNRTFGVPCLLFTLTFFLGCAEACFFSLHMLEVDYPLAKILMESVYLVPGVTLFLGFTYQCDALSREVSFQDRFQIPKLSKILCCWAVLSS